MKHLSTILFVLICIFMLGTTVWGQQIIGEYPSQDGGLEGQTIGSLGTTVSSTVWYRSTTSLTGTIVAGGRSGAKYTNMQMTGTSHYTLRGPNAANLLASTSYIIQFYYRGDKNNDGASNYGDIRGGISGASYVYGTYNTAQNQSNWTKYTAAVTPGANAAGMAVISIKEGTAAKVAEFDVDDIVIYAGSAADVTAPNSPGTVTVGTPTTTSLNVGWGAASGGVDGGGYLVVRGTSDPTTAPNTNGIYAVGNTVTTGQTVAYIGTSTSFTDNGLSSGQTYYYRVYTADKAFNYSSSSNGNGTTSSSSSSSSDIIANGSFTYPTDIPYASNTGTNVTSSNPEVFELDIRDGGGSADGDALSTTLTDITFSVTNSSVLEKVALYDGTSELGEVTASGSITFSGITAAAADNGSKTLNLRATYKSTVTDNTQFSFTVTSATANPSGSTFAAGNAGGAASSTSGNDNRIEVTATTYNFSTQPPATTVVNTNFSAGVEALDGNNNRDLDATTSVTLAASAGTLSSANLTPNLSSGVYNWSDLQNNTAGTGVTISATGSLTTATSNTMTIYSAEPTQATGAGFSNILTTSMDVSWTNGGGSNRIVLAKQGSAPTFTPSDGATYSYNSIFTSAPPQGDAKVVYIGTSNTFPLSGLTQNTTYYIAVYEFNGSGGTENYNITSPATNFQQTAASVSNLSDILAAGNETANLDYASYQSGTITTTSDGIRVWSFTIRDGGSSSPDGDSYGTEMTSVTIDPGTNNGISNWSNVIRQATLFFGSTKVADATTIGSTSIAFTSLSGSNVTAADDGSQTLDLYLSFKATVTDNEQFQFQITNANVTAAGSNSSLFTTFTAQTSSIGSDANKIEVTATKLNFSTQPPSTTTVNTSFSAGVEALDANNNRDLDDITSVTLSASAGTLSSSTGLIQSLASGVYNWSDLQNNTAGTGVTLGASGGSLTPATSNVMTISAAEPTTQASVVTFSSIASTSMTVGWTNGDGSNRIVLAKQGSAPTFTPSDGSTYSFNNDFSLAPTQGDAKVVYIGSSNSFPLSGLSIATTYHIAVFEFNGTAGVENYKLSPATGNQQTAGNTYTWSGGSSTWNTAGNWTPSRSTPATSDILQFSSGGAVTITAVPTETIGQLILSGSTTVNLQAGAASNVLTINGGPGTDLDVPTGSALNINGANAMTLTLATGATGSISGNMAYTTAAHKLNAADAAGIIFNSGSSLTQGTGCTSNIFTAAGTANAIRFANGSTFYQDAGSNPFGLGAPSSKVEFQAGSLFKFRQNALPSFSNRTYANFEVDFATFSQTVSSGATTWTVDSLIITQGSLTITSALPVACKGNLVVASGQTFNYSPGSSAAFTFQGLAVQTVRGSGTLTFGSNANVTLNNSNGLTLARNVSMNGTLTLTSGIITTGSNTLTIASTGSVTGAGAGKYIYGNLARVTAASGSPTIGFDVGDATNYTPVSLAINTLSASGTIAAATSGVENPNLGSSHIDASKSVNRYWTLTNTTAAFTNYAATFTFVTGDVDMGATTSNFIVGKYSTGSWSYPTVGSAGSTSTQATGLTSFSEFAIGEQVPNQPPTASSVNITGTPGIGQLLTGHYTYNDVDGDLEGTSTFRWLRDGFAIGGATASTYTVVLADLGTSITFEVTPVAQTGATPGTAVTSSGTTILNSAPTASSVNITGTPKVGELLTGNYTYGDVDGDGEGTSTFRWLRDNSPIGGATAQTYTVVLADLGTSIKFEVTPVAATGTTPGTAVASSGTTILNTAPTASSVNITGTPKVGQLLTGNYTYGDVDGDLEGTSTFRWLRDGFAIGGATASTYTVVLADLGTSITFEVTPVAATGTSPGTAATSSGTTILNSAPTASGVNITGTPAVGEVLTGHYTYGDVDGDLEGTTTFRWLRDDSPIGGETSTTYTLVTGDVGTIIKFEVTPVAQTGTTPGTAVESGGVEVGNSPPTASSVNITGTPKVGQLLTGHYTYGDIDGDLEGTSTFRWLRDGFAIGGATASTYTLVLADLDKGISFEVTPVAATGTSPGSPVASSEVTILNSTPTASSVNITGTPGVGQLLTGHYTYNDVDGDLEGTSTFRWLRDGFAIGGATASTYTVVLADLGTSITFEVTPVAQTGTTPGTAVTSSGTTILNSAPTATSLSITGTPKVGELLTGHYTYGDVDGDLEGTSTFRWLRDGFAIGGATSSTYTVVVADVGKSITFEVTPVAATGTSSGTAATSSGTMILNSAPTASGVNITGTPKVGQLLTGHYTYNDIDGDLEGTSTFRWLRDGFAIGGATASTYTVVLADLGTSITFEVTPVAATGTSPGTAATSSGTTILNSAPTASGVNITGTPTVGQVLTGHYTYNDVDGDLEGTSTFRWLRDNLPISGETAITYTLVSGDAGTAIKFEVTPVAQTGVSPGATVESSPLSITASGVISAQDGNWSDGSTWVGGVKPTSSQTAVINHRVTLTAADACAAATVNNGGVLDLQGFVLTLTGTFTLASGAEAKMSAFNPIPGGGTTPYAFDPASTYTFYGGTTGFSYSTSVTSITFGNVNWSSTGNATPAVGTIIAGNLVKSNIGELRGGTSTTSRVVRVNGNVSVNAGILYGSNSTTPATGGFDINGDLTIASGAKLYGTRSSGTATISIGGNLTNNGQIGNGTGSGAWLLYFKGSGSSNFTPGDTNTFKHVSIAPARTINLLDSMTVGSGYTLSDTGTFMCGINIVQGAGNFVLSPSATIGIGSPDGITTSGTTGNIQVAGTRTFDPAANYVYNGSVAQVTGNGFPTNCNNLTINNPAGVTLSSNHTVNGVLTFTNGNVITGIDSLLISETGSVSQTSGHVVGNLNKYIATGATAKTFEVGDATYYSPVDVAFGNVTTPGKLTVATTTAHHSNISTSKINELKMVNRYYTFTNNGLVFDNYNAAFTFASADIEGGADWNKFVVKKFDGAAWSSPTIGTKTATSTQIIDVTSFSDFAIGEPVPYELTVNSTAGGMIIVPSSETVTAYDGVPVTITASASTGYTFTGWTIVSGTGVTFGDASAISTTVTLTSGDAAILANFTHSTYQLTVTATAGGTVTVPALSPVTVTHGVASPITVVATAGYTFTGWTVVSGTGVAFANASALSSTATLTGGDATVQANFVVSTYQLTVTSTAGGTITVPALSPVTVTHAIPTTITVTGSTGYTFTGWTIVSGTGVAFGNASLLSTTATLTNGNAAVRANFVINTYTLTVNIIGTGSVTKTPNQVNYNYGTLVGLKAVPGHSWMFSVWGGDAIGSNDSVTITMNSDKTVSATFIEDPEYLTMYRSFMPESLALDRDNKGKLNKFVLRIPNNIGQYPMPNRVNVLFETFLYAGYGLRGMVVGMDRTWPIDSGRYYAWFQTNSYKYVLRTLITPKMQMHSGAAHGFDVYNGGALFRRKQTLLPPTRFNNVLLADMIALKLGITASAMGKIPRGFGELLYDDGTGTSNPLNGKMIKEIAAVADSDMMGQYNPLTRKRDFAPAPVFANIAQVIENINKAFEGVVDSFAFAESLYLKGVRELSSVAYLKANPNAIPAVIVPMENVIEQVPLTYQLYQNYPNPFNPTTTIQFDLPDEALVTLKIYNLLGQEVQTLLDREDMTEGTQEVQFDAQNLASGVYFYRIITEVVDEDGAKLNTFQTGKKMILIR